MYLANGTLLQGGKFKIINHISSGGFGNTYEAYDINLHKKIAIKELFAKDFCTRNQDTVYVSVPAKEPLFQKIKKKFIDEARTLANLEHENIVKVQALFEENGTGYYVMDYIEGESVANLLTRVGSLTEDKAVSIILKVADALAYMHSRKCYHLDIKPANIMLRNDGKVILIDFGASKQYTEANGENTSTIAPCYTCGFAPIEQMNASHAAFTAATDIYALGATLYKMLTGLTPPSAIDLLSGDDKLSSLPEGTSHEVQECIHKSMIPKQNARLQNIEEFCRILKPSSQPKVNDNDKTRLMTDEHKTSEKKDMKKKKETKKDSSNWLYALLIPACVLGMRTCTKQYKESHKSTIPAIPSNRPKSSLIKTTPLEKTTVQPKITPLPHPIRNDAPHRLDNEG